MNQNSPEMGAVRFSLRLIVSCFEPIKCPEDMGYRYQIINHDKIVDNFMSLNFLPIDKEDLIKAYDTWIHSGCCDDRYKYSIVLYAYKKGYIDTF